MSSEKELLLVLAPLLAFLWLLSVSPLFYGLRPRIRVQDLGLRLKEEVLGFGLPGFA